VSNEAEVYNTAMSGYQAAIVEEQANYQKAQLTGDVYEAVRASQAIASLRTQANEYHKMASEHARSMQPTSQPASNKFGLSPAEAEVARNSFGPIKRNGRMVDMTDDEKLEAYAKNKQRYRSMVADGSYSIDQGSVRR
jgi:hypothetical protein